MHLKTILTLIKIITSVYKIYNKNKFYKSNIYILNYINKATDKEEVETNFNRGFVKISIALIPVLILSVILILTSWLQIYSFAMIIFWGLAIAIIWNIIF